MNDPIRLDEHGRVRGSGIHDAVLIRLHWEESSLVLGFRGAGGEVRTFELTLVRQFGAPQFVSGMILADIWCLDLHRADLSGLDRGFAATLSGGLYDEAGSRQSLESLARAAAPETRIVLFEMSYGGGICVVCDGFSERRDA